jgi:hypothetical protein
MVSMPYDLVSAVRSKLETNCDYKGLGQFVLVHKVVRTPSTHILGNFNVGDGN